MENQQSTESTAAAVPSSCNAAEKVPVEPLVAVTTPGSFGTIYGTIIPNRIFVGGLGTDTTETDLFELFSEHGKVKSAKIIFDQAGASKGYGFVTFETREAARRLQTEGGRFVLGDRKLNIAPAFRKCRPISKTNGVYIPASSGISGLGNGFQYHNPTPAGVMHPLGPMSYPQIPYGNYGGGLAGGTFGVCASNSPVITGGGGGGPLYAPTFIGQNPFVNYQYYATNMPMGGASVAGAQVFTEGGAEMTSAVVGAASYTGVA